MKMKQVIGLICAAALSVSLVGCSNSQSGANASGAPGADPSQSVTTVKIAAGCDCLQQRPGGGEH